jgi:hypothetical protein
MPIADRLRARHTLTTLRLRLEEVDGKLRRWRRDAMQHPGDAALVAGVKELEQLQQNLRDVYNLARMKMLDNGDGIDLIDRRLPLALLPVRLETRYRGDTLLVRIYPDTIHLDAHALALSEAERAAWKHYRHALEGDEPKPREAWAALVAAVGARRAIHVAEVTDPDIRGLRPGGWSSPGRARALPDRFVACVWLQEPLSLRSSSPDVVQLAEELVRDPLLVTPDPLNSDSALSPLGAQAAWLTDFAAALKAGMAIEVPLGSPTAVVHRLVVVGVDAGRDAAAGAAELAALLRAHECTDGLDVCTPGEPTNALPGERTSYMTDPTADVLYDAIYAGARTVGKPAEPNFERVRGRREDCASFRLTVALGLPAETLGYTARGAVQRDARSAMDLRQLLVLLLEPGLAEALGDTVSTQDLGAVLTDFVAGVGEEELPVLRIGDQPYGILPVGQAGNGPVSAFDAALEVLRDQVYAPALQRVPRVGSATAANSMQVLLDILRSDARPRSIWLRLSVSLALALAANRRLARSIPGEPMRNEAAALLGAMGHPAANDAPLLDRLYLDPAALATLPLVLDTTPGAPPPAITLAWLASQMAFDDILEDRYFDRTNGSALPPPRTVLFQLARHAVLAAAHADAMATIVADTDPAQAVTRQTAIDHPEFFEPGGSADGTWWALARGHIVAARQQIFQPGSGDTYVIDEALAPRSHTVQNLLDRLRQTPPAVLEHELLNAISLLSHRLDAWLSRRVGQRLSEIRRDPTTGTWVSQQQYAAGLSIGAWGLVERIDRKGPGSTSGSYTLAPSLAQAATAGVLMSADFADWNARRGSSFALDLSSRRVRRARRLLEGIAMGQPLGALLGYAIERTLVERGGAAPQMIAPLRRLAPIEANRLTPDTVPAETVSANAVVNGLALLHMVTIPDSTILDVKRLPTSLVTDELALKAALEDAADTVDALSDVLLAESVHQLVLGHSARAAAAANAMSGQPVLPGDLEVLRTHLRGDAVGHRVLCLFDVEEAHKGWISTPRSLADAAADAWAGALLPPPGNISLVLTDGTQSWKSTLGEVLATAKQHARDDLALAALDVVLMASTAVAEPSARLEQRILALAEFHVRGKDTIAPSTPSDTLRLVLERSAAWGPARIGVPELRAIAAALRALLLGSRALGPSDLPLPATVDTQDQANRLTAAREAAESLVSALTKATPAAEAITRARHWTETPPAAPNVPLAEQAQNLKAELQARLAASNSAASWSERMKALLGATQPALPVLRVDAASATSAWGAPLRATENELRAFVLRAARVRSKMTTLDDALLAADLLSAGASQPYRLKVAQTPAGAGETWVGLSKGVPPGRTGHVAVCVSAKIVHNGNAICGLFVDDWTELVPEPDVDGALAFRTEMPASEAPNAILLCNPPPRETWQLEDIVLAVQEALYLAQMRVIDPDVLGAGQLLPAMVLRDRLMPGSLLGRLANGTP